MSGANWLDLMKDAQAGGGFAPIPEGDYDLKVIEATAKTSSGGKPMYELKAEIQTGPHAKRLVWDRLIISKESPGALRYFFRKMGALGLGEEFFAQGPTDQQITTALNGRAFRAKLGIREYNQKQTNEIKEYYPAVAALGTPVPPPVVAAAPPAPAPAVAPPPAPAAAPGPWDNAPAPAPAAPAVPPPPAPPAPGGFVAPPAPPF